MLNDQDRYSEALEYYDKSLEVMFKVHGQDHPVAAGTLYNIALAHRELEAECFDKCVVIYGKVHGDAHSKTVHAGSKQQGLAPNLVQS